MATEEMREEIVQSTGTGKPFQSVRARWSPLIALALIATLAGDLFAQGARRDEEEPEPPPQPTLTAPPEVIEAATPVYPEQAAAAGLEAVVKIRVHIDAEGTVTKVDVLEPVGHGFDEAATAAALQYRFKPAEWDGVPGPIVVETAIHFTLEKVEEVVPVGPEPDFTGGTELPEGPASHGGDLSQPIAIEGKAMERGSRRKLAGVIVSIAELGIDAITDEAGRFFFHGVRPGEYRIIAVDDRFDRFERSLTVAAGERVEAVLYLRAKGGNPYETVVEGEREVLEVTRRTIERRQMTTVPGTFGDPIRVIQTLPGLARTPFVSGFLLIRGSNPDDSGVYIDGHQVPLLFHFLGGPSILNAEFLEKIDLYPGGYPARFGRATGGIVAVETRSSKSDGVHGSADVDLLDAGGYLRVPVSDDSSFAVAGRRSYLDTFLDTLLPEAEPGEILVVVPVYYDYQLRYDYNFGTEGRASLFYLRSSDTLDVLSADPEAEEFFNLNTAINFSRLIGSYQRPIAGGLRLTLSSAYGSDSVTFAGSQTEGSSPFTGLDIEVTTLGYRARVEGRLHEHLVLDAGIDLDSRVTRYDLLVPAVDDIREDNGIDIPPELLVINSDAFLYGLHADVAVDIRKLRLIPGLRVDGSLLNGNNLWSVDPRLVARYTIDDRWLAKGYIGLFHQPPQPEALDRNFGNPDLGLEKAMHTGLGGEWAFADNWMADLELYYIDRWDIVEFTQDTERNPNTGELEPVNFRNSRIGDTIGLEFLLKREVTRNLFGWLSYTLSRSRELEFDDVVYEPTAFDQRHTLNAVASYRLDSGWELGGRYRLSTGRPITDVVGSTFDADSGGYRRVNGPYRGSRRKTFHQVDARAEKVWLFDTWLIGVYLDVQNLFNIENEEAIQYDYRYRERAPVTGVPFIPTIGIRGQF